MKRTIYFDYNATTPLDPAVRDAMLPFLGEVFGNPSSVHHVGRRARALLDGMRERVAGVLHCKPGEVVFTSGGTEACNLALFGTARRLRDKGRHILTSPVEHHAVLNCCQHLVEKEGFEVSYLPVNAEGIVDASAVEKRLRPDTILVSVMAANNETGAIQPVAEIGAICRDRGVAFHTDAVQWFGKEPFTSIHQFNADLVSICAHKFHGPKGAGVLFVRSPLHPVPLLFGGSHEYEQRAGTENLAAISGLSAALERFVRVPVFARDHLLPLTSRVLKALEALPGARFRGSRSSRLCNTVAFSTELCDSTALLAALDLEGVCASSGSACSAGSLLPSHVLLAMGASVASARGLIRFSLGRESSAADVESALQILQALLQRLRSCSSLNNR